MFQVNLRLIWLIVGALYNSADRINHLDVDELIRQLETRNTGLWVENAWVPMGDIPAEFRDLVAPFCLRLPGIVNLVGVVSGLLEKEFGGVSL